MLRVPRTALGLLCLATLGARYRSPRRIAFASNRDGNWELYVMDPGGARQTRLTTRGEQDRFPMWSPDGARLAFISGRDGYDAVYVMDADGRNVRRLTESASLNPVWAP